MEPTIYKPSVYKGAGIYKTGAEGGGTGFNGVFDLNVSELDLSRNQNIQYNTIINLIDKENLSKNDNKLILKNAQLEIDLTQHVTDSITKIEIETKYNVIGISDYGYIGAKFITTFGGNNFFQNFGLVVATTGLSDFVTSVNYNTGWTGYSRYAPFQFNSQVNQKEHYEKSNTSYIQVNNELIASGKYNDSTIFSDTCKIQSQNASAIIELEKLKITWS